MEFPALPHRVEPCRQPVNHIASEHGGRETERERGRKTDRKRAAAGRRTAGRANQTDRVECWGAHWW